MFFELIFPFLEDIVVGVECVFCWYWIADLYAQHSVSFVLGHALYMKAIHGGKTKNDKIDSFKIAALLRGGNFPLAYTYPAHMRATRDLLRSIPGVGQILTLVILYEICDIKPFATVQDFSSYARLIRPVKDFVERLTKKHNKGNALGILTHKLGRAIFFMLKNNEAFNMKRFFSS
jgi:transposase